MFKDKLEDLLQFFDSVQLKNFSNTSYLSDEGAMGNWLSVYNYGQTASDFNKFEVALVFVGAYADSDNDDVIQTPQNVREQFYALRKFSSGLRVADLGDLKTGNTVQDAMFALQEVCSILFSLNINTIIVGGSQLFTLGAFKAFEEFENNINLIHIDSKLDLSVEEENIETKDYLSNLIFHESSHLYNIACLGYQGYFVGQEQTNKLNELYFEHTRLGDVRANIEGIEPIIRDGDLVSFDISAIRMSEAPGQVDGSPNGLYADEACRLARYAGISDRVQQFGLYEIDNRFDINKQTAKLAAQILWHYLEGYINRKHDFPQASLDDCTKYSVQIDEIDFPIVFYKSDKSNRWWLEVKSVSNQDSGGDPVVVSCSFKDYQLACKNEIPDRWWINFKKLE